MQFMKFQRHFDALRIVLILGSTFLSMSCLSAQEMSGQEIMDEISRHQDSTAELESLTMTLTDKKGKTTSRTLRQYSLKNTDGLYKYLLVFDEPNGIKGVALLTWEKQGGDDDQWLYLPAMGNKLKRIASGGRMNYFMGTDFAFEDLVVEKPGNFEYERQADQKFDGVDVFVVDARPSDPKLVTGYKKRQLFVRKDDYIVVRVDYFQKRTGKLLKRLSLSELERIEGDQWRAKERLMEHFSKKHTTRITTLKRSFTIEDVPETVFTHRFITSRNHMR